MVGSAVCPNTTDRGVATCKVNEVTKGNEEVGHRERDIRDLPSCRIGRLISPQLNIGRSCDAAAVVQRPTYVKSFQ